MEITKTIGKVVLLIAFIGACLLYVVKAEAEKPPVLAAENVFEVRSYHIGLDAKLYVFGRDGRTAIFQGANVEVFIGKPSPALPDGVYVKIGDQTRRTAVYVGSESEKQKLEFQLRGLSLPLPAPQPFLPLPAPKPLPLPEPWPPETPFVVPFWDNMHIA